MAMHGLALLWNGFDRLPRKLMEDDDGKRVWLTQHTRARLFGGAGRTQQTRVRAQSESRRSKETPMDLEIASLQHESN